MPFQIDPHVASAAIYLAAVPIWLLVWRSADGYALMRGRARLLWLPFLLALGYFALNALLAVSFPGLGSAMHEEGRIAFVGERAMLTVQAVASVLIVATIVYGLTVRRLPMEFIRFMAYAVVAILGLVAPILWIPDGAASAFYLLRHFQNSALLAGLFLCVAGIITMLADLIEHGDAEVFIDPREALREIIDRPSGLRIEHLTDDDGARPVATDDAKT